MPAQSQHFTDLVAAFNLLKSTYISTSNSSGIPHPKEQELARAFVMLMHAEIEFYFESMSAELITLATSEFAAGRIGVASLGLIALTGLPPLNGGEQLVPNSKAAARKVAEQIYRGGERLRKVIEGNNGMRQKYLAPLFVPLGLTQEAIDPVWIVDIDSFADKRGAFAHKSMFHVEAESKNINPLDELKLVTRIVFDDPVLKSPNVISSIESFDAWASAQGAVSMVTYRNKRHSSLLRRTLWKLVSLIDRWEQYRLGR